MRNRVRCSVGLAFLLQLACQAEIHGPREENSAEVGGAFSMVLGGSQGTGVGGEATLPGSSGGSAEQPTVAPTSFVCDEARVQASVPLRRLTKLQYKNTVFDLTSMLLGSSSAALDVMTEVADALELVVEDERPKVPEDLHGSYRRLDQRVQQAHVDAWFEMSERVAQALTDDARKDALWSECALELDACLNDFVRRLGRLALRRPLGANEVAFYRGFYGELGTELDTSGLQDVIAGFLNSPQFLYLVEHGSDDDERVDTSRLGAYELASRLSYHFWNTMPDEHLLDLAESGALLDPDTYEQEVDRLWLDSRTEETINEFYREWLKLEDLPDLTRNNQTDIFQNFAGEALPSSTLRAAMQDEVLALLNYFTWSRPSSLSEVFQTELNFARSDELARLYGAQTWDGESAPAPLAGRPGILTRGAFLATGTPNTRPIMKGLFIRKNILCDEIDPPPENAAAIPPELSPTLTTREVVEQLTGSGICAECHESHINPLGFATENFDALGRNRSEQILFDEQGDVIGQKPIDTSSVPQVLLGDMTRAAGAEDLMDLLVASGKVEACFARHYFRFTFGRFEGVVSDGCALEYLRSSLIETGSLADTLRDVALGREFQTRSFLSSTDTEEP